VTPQTVSFADQLDGRRLLFAVIDRYVHAPATAFRARWLTERMDGTRPASGAESVALDRATKRVAIATETDGPPQSLVRAISDGDTLIATLYRATSPAPLRQVVRLPLQQTVTLSGALALVQFTPQTVGVSLLLSPDGTPVAAAAPLIYADRSDAAAATADGRAATVVVVVDAPTVRGPRQQRSLVVHRYVIDTDMGLLIRYEEWTVVPGRDFGEGLYRREDYSGATPVLRPGAFSQTLPPTYVEQPLPSVTLPPPPARPKQADSAAVALLERWRRASARLLSENVTLQVAAHADPRTPASNPRTAAGQSAAITYTFWLQRPNLLQLRVHVAGAGRTPRRARRAAVVVDAVAVSDGRRLQEMDDTSTAGQSRTIQLPSDPGAALAPRLAQARIPTVDNALAWWIDGAPTADQFDSVTLDPGDASGHAVLLTTSTHADDRRGRITDATVSWRIQFGDDGLPREMDSRSETHINGMFDRDQPPIATTQTQVTVMAIDSEPPADCFAPLNPPQSGAMR
jgi:hypothetical protein